MRDASRIPRLKEAVIASFYAPASEVEARLAEFSAKDWQRVQFWLDTSGLALYFLDRLRLLRLLHLLPEILLAQMEQDLQENRMRVASLYREAVALGLALRQQEVSFALLKGMTLWPESVPDCTLRFQLDLDFLIAERDAIAAQHCLRSFGYALHAISGKTWEFKAGAPGTSDIRKIYQVTTSRSVELHLLSTPFKSVEHVNENALTRAQLRRIQGADICALAPADLFLHQAHHLFKHMCSEHTRASWVLEFWRHVLARRDDVEFWSEVELLTPRDSRTETAVGAVTLLASQALGQVAPQELSTWSINRLSPGIRRWIEMYGHRILLADFPGNKLYLLLLQQLQTNASARRSSLRRLIIPIHWPPQIAHGGPSERAISRLMRYFLQFDYVMKRLRFHVMEGVRYALESLRWQRRLTGVEQ